MSKMALVREYGYPAEKETHSLYSCSLEGIDPQRKQQQVSIEQLYIRQLSIYNDVVNLITTYRQMR